MPIRSKMVLLAIKKFPDLRRFAGYSFLQITRHEDGDHRQILQENLVPTDCSSQLGAHIF